MTVQLQVIEGVELAQLGTWNTMSPPGGITFTADDFADAVRAATDPGFNTPQVFLGHGHAALGDGNPSVGRIENVRLSDDGVTLIGDLHVLPGIAELAAVSWPRRSIEADLNTRSASGQQYRMALTGVALLGETLPAIQTLADLQALATVTASDTPEARHVAVTFEGAPMPNTIAAAAPTTVAASAPVEDVRRAWWTHQDTLGGIFTWSYVRAIYAGDEQFLIVETEDADEDGVHLWRVDWTETDGTVTFGEPSGVREAFVEASATSSEDTVELTAPGTVLAARYTGRNSARGLDPSEVEELIEEIRRQLLAEGVVHAASDATPSEDMTDRTDATEQVEASADATDETTETVDESGAPVADETAPDAEDTTETGEDELDDLTVLVDRAQLEALTAELESLRETVAATSDERYDNEVDGWVRAGRINEASRKRYRAKLEEDPDGTRSLVANLATGVRAGAIGHAHTPEPTSQTVGDAYRALPGLFDLRKDQS